MFAFFVSSYWQNMNLPISIPSIFATKNGYGRLVNLAGYTERSSEDNKEHNRPDPHAQEEKRMNFVRKYAYN